MAEADKLHNAHAIHTDLMIDGPDMLARINGEPDQILAYYRSILAVLESRGIAPVLVVLLRHAFVGPRRILGDGCVFRRRTSTDA